MNRVNVDHQTYLRDFDRMASHLPADRLAEAGLKIEGIAAETRAEFETLLHKMPQIDPRHVWMANLVQSAMYLALLRTLTRHGMTQQEAEQTAVALYENYLGSQPKFALSALHWYTFSPFQGARLRHWARLSQQKINPDDWVLTYVPGDGRNFDFGVDVTECAICKFYKAEGAEALLPALCRMDFVMDDFIHTGLCRGGTLAEGKEKCDFRYRKNAPAECQDS